MKDKLHMNDVLLRYTLIEQERDSKDGEVQIDRLELRQERGS
jgi:hypothetical protein